jgi:hypothetical protein
MNCPQCGSEKVYVFTVVTGYSWVNVNTYEADEPPCPDECEVLDFGFVEYEPITCFNCDHTWDVRKKEKKQRSMESIVEKAIKKTAAGIGGKGQKIKFN